ncbi:MAG: undecaprenyl-diphosphate phosphatase, partial [Spirochaetaceae bacterium]|nr:undecaprenyl-diphosphate phosphatase [Spirochaetaceae bacterium]
MTVIQAVLLGLIQGATEFLPVSSSGHLVLARALMDLREIPVLFDVILHLATLIVVIWVFRARVGTLLAVIVRFVIRRTREDDAPTLRLAMYLVGASALTAVIGFGISELEIRNSPSL